jgi:hypothetical protein
MRNYKCFGNSVFVFGQDQQILAGLTELTGFLNRIF